MQHGFLHLYIGDGKGKTTAAIGLAARAAGCGKQVVLGQFLKATRTGELASLKMLGVTVIRSEKNLGFTWDMDGNELAVCRAEQALILERIKELFQATPRSGKRGVNFAPKPRSGPQGANAPKSPADILILDELLDVLSLGLLDEEVLKAFLKGMPEELELVLTGRSAPEWLTDSAGYITEMKKVKHPYDTGAQARQGIEY